MVLLYFVIVGLTLGGATALLSAEYWNGADQPPRWLAASVIALAWPLSILWLIGYTVGSALRHLVRKGREAVEVEQKP